MHRRLSGALLKTAIKWIVSLAIGALFVWLSARGGRFDELLRAPIHLDGTVLWSPGTTPIIANDVVIGEAARGGGWSFDLLYILPYLAVLSAIHFLRVIRWAPLLRPLAPVDFPTLNRIGAVGFMAVFLFPLRLGEFVRPYMLAKSQPRIRMSEGLATIVVERVMDGLMVTLLLFLVLFQMPQDSASFNEIRLGAWAALAVFVGGIVVLIGLYWRREQAIDLIEAIVGRVSRKVAHGLSDLLRAFLKGLAVLPDWRNFAWFCVITAVYWGINGVGLWLFAKGFGLDVPLVAAYAMMSCVVVGMMIPNSPGNVGTFWYFLLLPLELYGIGPGIAQATVYGLVVYVMQLAQQSLFGLWFLASGKVSAHDVIEGTHADDVVGTMEVEEGVHEAR